MFWFAMILGAIGIVCLIIAGSILESPDAEKKDRVLAIRLGAIGGLLLLYGIFIVGTFMARTNAGRPIAEFRDGNIYILVSFSEIVDDQKTVVVGLRKIQDGRNWASEDARLRMYRLPVGMLSASGVSRKPPYYLKFIKTGDCTSFEVYRKTPLPKGK